MRSKIVQFKIIGVLLCGSFVCNAQKELSIEHCISMALEHNQSIKSAKAKIYVSDASFELSRRAVLPRFDFSGNYTYLNDPSVINIPSFELPTINNEHSGVLYPGLTKQMAYNNSYNAGIGMSLPLYMGGKLNEYKNISKYGQQIANENLVYEKSELVHIICVQYWALVSLEEKKILSEKSIEFLSDLATDMQNRYESELVTKNEVLKTAVKLNDAKLNLIEISNSIELSKMMLNKIIGNNLLDDIMLIDSIINIPKTLSFVDDIENSIDNRPENKILESQLTIANSQLEVVKSYYKPQLVSFANYQFQNPNHQGVDDGEFTWNAGFTLKIPIFHWGEKQLKVQKQTMENRQVRLLYESTREYMMLEIQKSIFKLKESLIKLEMTSESLIQAKENLLLERNRLDEGLNIITDLLNAQMQWQKSHADYIDAKVNYKICESNYIKSIGVGEQ